jgi:hypothetical protein
MLLVSPIWLFALAALSIPVAIHLWNIRPGKTLKVGSIALFTESSPKSSRSFKLLDILLLLLRCLLLILLAFLLAGPFWQQHLKAGKTKGWLLIPKENFNEVYQRFKPDIDSIGKKGYEFHYFDQSFPKADINELLQHPGKDTATAQPANYWALVRQLEHHIPATVTAELFTPNTISHFRGEKPATGLTLNWHTYTPADSVNTWLAGAWLTVNGNIRVVQGTATPGGTSYQYNDIKNGGQTGSVYQVGVDNGIPVVSLKNSKISVDTTTQRIAIYTDKHSIDANYLKAALMAVSQFTQRKTIIRQYTDAETIPADQDWIFWLSEDSIDDEIIDQAKNVLHYEDGKALETDTWMSNSGNEILMQGAVKIALHKNIGSKNIGSPVWADSFGNAVLSLDKGKTNMYHFFSRFNPAWNDLVWSDDFPKWIMDLTNHQPFEAGDHERRAISADQLQPTRISGSDMVANTQVHPIELTNYLWLALVLAFFAERWLATKNKTVLANG